MKPPAVFLDRDGTIIEDRGYLADPADVQLLPGAVDALRRLSARGFRLVVVSNQSGVARGLFDENRLADVHARLESLLAAEGVRLDAAYYCPYLDGPEAVVERYRRDSELRKPRPGMLLQAARELGLDLSQSWMVGNSPSDVEAGRRAGCRTILLHTNGSPIPAAPATFLARGVEEAADLVEQTLASAAPMSSDTAGAAVAAGADAPPGPAATSPPGNGAPAAPDAVVGILERIHEQLDRAHRPQRQQDFSLLRLFAALLQMLAVVVALWGMLGLFDEENAAATARFTLGCFLQGAALTAFALDRWR